MFFPLFPFSRFSYILTFHFFLFFLHSNVPCNAPLPTTLQQLLLELEQAAERELSPEALKEALTQRRNRDAKASGSVRVYPLRGARFDFLRKP